MLLWVGKPSPSLTWTDNRGIDYHHNSAGIRSDKEFDKIPSENVLRIALFGDSYTYGSAANLEDTWAYHLEQELMSQGIPNEVLNFGVGGYGIDQAYLRWLHEGKLYHPDIVVFGYMVDDIPRNANIFRGLLRLSKGGKMNGTIYSKPRFIMDSEALSLIENPANTIDELFNAYVTLDNDSLRHYDMYYDPDKRNIFLHSKLIALLFDTISSESPTITSEHEFSEDKPAIDS